MSAMRPVELISITGGALSHPGEAIFVALKWTLRQQRRAIMILRDHGVEHFKICLPAGVGDDIVFDAIITKVREDGMELLVMEVPTAEKATGKSSGATTTICWVESERT
jgi:hypothetical protein